MYYFYVDIMGFSVIPKNQVYLSVMYLFSYFLATLNFVFVVVRKAVSDVLMALS